MSQHFNKMSQDFREAQLYIFAIFRIKVVLEKKKERKKKEDFGKATLVPNSGIVMTANYAFCEPGGGGGALPYPGPFIQL